MATKLYDLFSDLEREGIRLHVKVNDNRQTMLSVKWSPVQTKISIHRMFLKAPDNVVQALARYIKREHKSVSVEIKAFIEENQDALDYSYLLDLRKLEAVGEFYNIQKIYEKLNRSCFDDSLHLSITWFGHHLPKNRSRCSLGLYYDTLKLIKIHRLLDNSAVPEYVVEFVVYHEMLHAICPAYIDERGVHRVHGEEFKKREESFYSYKAASDWIKNHQMNFFLFQGYISHGGT
ncbi:MAG: hypothetical protein JWO53_588 [Chlamydiia bacterium]|nr:hypothetical protein [Chlamydiia bacterium]